MKIYIATDHRGLEVEKELIGYLADNNIEVVTSDIPHNDTDDYVDFALDICKKIAGTHDLGILICGSGIGMSIIANKVKGIRAARCVTREDAYLTRNDNDANVICLSYKLDINELKQIVETFINTPFSNAERHNRRVDKIIKYENGEYNGL